MPGLAVASRTRSMAGFCLAYFARYVRQPRVLLPSRRTPSPSLVPGTQWTTRSSRCFMYAARSWVSVSPTSLSVTAINADPEDLTTYPTLLRFPLVYRVPPRSSNAGYRAEGWGDLANPLWKGRMRIIESSKCVIRLEDPSSGKSKPTVPFSKRAFTNSMRMF